MPKIQYLLYSSLILIIATFFITLALSQVVTNTSNVSSSVNSTGKTNGLAGISTGITNGSPGISTGKTN